VTEFCGCQRHSRLTRRLLFLVVEPEGLDRLWGNIRNYFRMWLFSY
jgi:hypothetical protein